MNQFNAKRYQEHLAVAKCTKQVEARLREEAKKVQKEVCSLGALIPLPRAC